MLKSLYIQNFVLIDNLDIRFDDKFTVITGETGAGKSIMLGALALVLGQRADAKSIKSGAAKCVIEATFDITAYDLKKLFESHDMEYDDEICILRRELFASGKSRAFVNDSPVSLSAMKEVGNLLIDIHSQHQNLLIADNHFQLNVVDVIAGNSMLQLSYKERYGIWQSLKKELASIQEKAEQAKKNEDYIRFQLEQLDEAGLKDGEQEELEQEAEMLSHAEEIKGSLYKIYTLLSGDESGGLLLVKEALSVSDSLSRFYTKSTEFSQRLRSAYIDLSDLSSEMEALAEDIEFNPERLDWINNRLNTIYSLQQKHHVSTTVDLIGIQKQYREELTHIESFEDRIIALKKQLEEAYGKLVETGKELSVKRLAAAQPVATQLVEMVTPLGMPNLRFRVDVIHRDEPMSDGMDEVRFMFSANKSGELERVAQIASGGEISRLMLCIKAMIAGYTALPTIIFDEVDTGVSGDIADKMGDIMQGLGSNMQVITITHLPQIAAKGRVHYFVYKEDLADSTNTCIRRLDANERVTEVARMVSGATLTKASIANARDLLRQ